MTNHCFPKGDLIEELHLMEGVFDGVFDLLVVVASKDLHPVYRPFF